VQLCYHFINLILLGWGDRFAIRTRGPQKTTATAIATATSAETGAAAAAAAKIQMHLLMSVAWISNCGKWTNNQFNLFCNRFAAAPGPFWTWIIMLGWGLMPNWNNNKGNTTNTRCQHWWVMRLTSPKFRVRIKKRSLSLRPEEMLEKQLHLQQ